MIYAEYGGCVENLLSYCVFLLLAKTVNPLKRVYSSNLHNNHIICSYFHAILKTLHYNEKDDMNYDRTKDIRR
jgi:hypothetical protein